MGGMRDAMSTRLRTVTARADDRRVPVPLVDSTALAAVGFETLCEAVGAVSIRAAEGGFYTSGWNSADGQDARTYTTSPANQRVGVPASLTTRRVGFSRAFARLIEEAGAVRADGVVGVRVETSYRRLDQDRVYDVVVHGVAVRAIRGPRPPRIFTTSLPGVSVAAALRDGLVPVTYVRTPVMGVRYIDPISARQLRRRAGNGEIEALTDLLSVCRERARADFAAAARRSGAGFAVVDEVSCDLVEGSTTTGLHTAQAQVVGTALASFTPPSDRPRRLAVVPLAALSRHTSAPAPDRSVDDVRT